MKKLTKEQFWDALSKPTEYRKSCRWCKHYVGKTTADRKDFRDRAATNNVASSGHCVYPGIHPGFGCIMEGHKYFEYDNTRT